MTIFLLCVIVYLLATLTIAISDSDWNAAELIALATWPISIPLGEAWSRWHNFRRTCPVCKHRKRDRAAMLAHRVEAHPVGSVQGSGEGE